MTNQDATYILSGLRKSLHEYCGSNDNAHKAFDMAISALQEQEAKRLIESSLTQKPLDTISRTTAIDTEGLDEEVRCAMCRNQMKTDRGCDGNCKYDEKLYEKIMQILNERIKPLPSAQPEIVRCKDCKYGEQDEVGRWFCRSLGCQIGDEDGSGFCADAERRTDG